ncbi:MAG TPA: calcium/sodium antiporter, partial [Spirochaetota bacterium]|nr:calcium/sodium antiporter [Spirochaetota bacterium]
AMLVNGLLLLVGFVFLLKGADFFVEAASSLARKMRVSEIAIGLTVVSFGTSAPELLVNVMASVQGSSSLVLSNVIGSNIFNILLILGVSGLIYPLVVQKNTVWKEIPFSLLAVVMLFTSVTMMCALPGEGLTISRLEGMVFLVIFVAFLLYVYRISGIDVSIDVPVEHMSTLKIIVFLLVGILGLVIGGRLVVTGAVALSSALGISQRIIGLTVVSAGTSLPELATSAVAAYRQKSDMAVGNVIGSNIFNILFILGISAIIRPVEYDRQFDMEMIIVGIATLFLFVAMFTGRKRKLDRWEALIMLLVFFMYLVYLISG